MILTYQNTCFIKIPKTGGTTILSGVAESLGASRDGTSIQLINPVQAFHRAHSYYGWHSTAEELRHYLGKQWETFTCVSIIRCPFERIQSIYRWQKQKVTNTGSKPGRKVRIFMSGQSRPVKNISYFIDSVLNKDEKLTDQALLHAIPQVHWLKLDSKISDRIHLFRTEDISARYEEIFALLNVKTTPMIARNVSTKDEPIALASGDIAKLEKLYYEDIELFNSITL
ncbi:MAG: sulfotransferase family 2 domain-containing protein [Halioglobus sp.]|nr:sulfotransferase family 2 domain-containing protein [Halioglobus sp.]